MNDRFLSRGKLKADNLPHKKGDWVFGYFVILKDGDRDVPFIYGFGEIVPETLGGCTGSNDKNGKKIFEDDIVRIKNQVGYVFFADDSASFVIETEEAYFSMDYSSECEVIGNIYDNKQMLIRADMLDSNDVFQPVFQPALKSATPENFELMQG